MKDIAVVGLACRFPGAENYNQYWNNLVNSVKSINKIPEDRLVLSQYFSENTDQNKEESYKWGGFLEKIDQFDNKFFNISSREAENMDPQQRILLEETWHCVEDSGIALEHLQKNTTAVYVGAMTSDYLQESVNPEIKTNSYTTLGCYDCILSNRISYFFNWNGPSKTVGAACASSLVALHQAKNSLRSGECDFAIVASVNLNFHPWKNISFSRLRMLSPSGQCKTFDKDANGYVPGEGIGVVLLQPIENALQERNNIYGILKGSSVNHCGHTQSLTAPRVSSQKKLILNAFKDADVNPGTVTYVEAHGTGTSLGDPIEIEAFNQAFMEHSKEKHYCKIGSVKTNIGHLEASSGMAALIKVLLMIRHRQIPALVNFKTANPIINFKYSPFSIATERSRWKPKKENLPLRASINSFGIGGISSHIVVEELKTLKSVNDIESIPASKHAEYLFLLSTKQVESMNQLLLRWLQTVENDRTLMKQSIENICATLQNRVTDFEYRVAFKVKNHADLKRHLMSAPQTIRRSSKTPWCLHIGDQHWSKTSNIAYKFIPQELFQGKLQLIKNTLRYIGFSPVREMYLLDELLNSSNYALFRFIIDYSFLSVLMDLGFAPDFIVAEKENSMLGLVLSDSMSLNDALSVLCSKQEFNKIEFRRPKIPIKFSGDNQVLLPFDISEDYIKFLLDQSVIYKRTFERLVKSARLIINSQYTFRLFIKEWDKELKQFGIDIESMLSDDKILEKTGDDFHSQRLLILVAIESSLTKLNEKWGLTREMVIDDKISELVDHIVDGIITISDFLDLIFDREKTLTSLVESLNKRQHLIDLSRPYKYLQRFSQRKKTNKSVLADNSKKEHSQLKNLSVEDINFLDFKEMKCFQFGETFNDINAATTVKYLSKNQENESLANILRKLWLEGVNIKWNLTNSNQLLLKKISLPVYEFVPKSFWLTKNSKNNIEKEDLSNQHEQQGILKLIELLKTDKINENRFIQKLKSNLDYSITENQFKA